MTERYEVNRYGRLAVYANVTKETAKTFTYQDEPSMWSPNPRPWRKSTEGTFATIREAVESYERRLAKIVANQESRLDLDRRQLVALRDALGKSDERLDAAVRELLK